MQSLDLAPALTFMQVVPFVQTNSGEVVQGRSTQGPSMLVDLNEKPSHPPPVPPHWAPGLSTSTAGGLTRVVLGTGIERLSGPESQIPTADSLTSCQSSSCSVNLCGLQAMYCWVGIGGGLHTKVSEWLLPT